jgi:hypothetical protein
LDRGRDPQAIYFIAMFRRSSAGRFL